MEVKVRWYLLMFLIMIPMIMADTTIRNGNCNAGETCMFSMYEMNDSHIASCTYFNYSVCYPTTITTTYSNGSCGAGYNFILSSYNENDSHVSVTDGYFDFSLCSNNLTSCTTRASCNASEQGIISLFQINDSHTGELSNYTNNLCCSNIITNVTTNVTPTIVGGGGTSHIITDIYDVSVHVEKNKYTPESEVEALITFINLGDKPDKDTVITYYLVDPFGNNISPSREQFYEVPPIHYNKAECKSAGGVIEWYTGRCIYKLKRTIALPTNTSIGYWNFNVDYYTPTQGDIYVYDSFEVIKKKFNFYWLIVLAIIIIYGLERRRINKK